MIYQFLDFELDASLKALRRAGEACAIEPQVFDLLLYLVENRDRLISHDELIEHVWRGRIVADATIASRIRAVRKVLGDTGADQKIIQTQSKRGFRFVAEIDEKRSGSAKGGLDETAAGQTRDAEYIKPSIAVLPFENMSGDPEQEYFSDGISEDIIASLATVPWFLVIPRSSTFSFRGQNLDSGEINRTLRADYVLDGSVRKAGQRIRVSARLVDASEVRTIWTQRYDRELTDIFAIQDEITEQIVGSVAPEFLSAEMGRARRKGQRNLSTWDVLMRAHWHLNRFSRADNEEARTLLHQVIALDPKNDLAFGDLATTYVIGVPWGWYERPQEMIDAALEAADRAIAINERNVPALLARAHAEIFIREFDTSVRHARQALALAPNSPDTNGWCGVCLTHACEWEEARELLDIALRLGPKNPLNAIWSALVQLVLFQTEQYEQCIRWTEKILDELPICLPAVHRPMAASFAMLDRPEEATQALKQLKLRLPTATPETVRTFPFKDPIAVRRFVDAMEKAEAMAASSS